MISCSRFSLEGASENPWINGKIIGNRNLEKRGSAYRLEVASECSKQLTLEEVMWEIDCRYSTVIIIQGNRALALTFVMA